MKFKVGEMVNVLNLENEFGVHDGLGIIFGLHTLLNDMYAIQISNNDWNWYREAEIEKLILMEEK